MRKLNEYKDAAEFIRDMREDRRNDDYTLHVIDAVESCTCHVCGFTLNIVDDVRDDDKRKCMGFECPNCNHSVWVEFDRYGCVIT